MRTSRKAAREAREWRALTRTVKSGFIAAACGLWSLAPSAMAAPAANEVPTGGTKVAVDSGDVVIDKSQAENGILNINQSANRAIINWDTFNVGENAVVNFNHYKGTLGKDAVQNTAGVTLNRVVGSEAGMSQIYGTINSVGSVILVNQNGILFDGNASVNAAGIIASTADLDTDKFISGKELRFSQDNKTNNNVIVTGNAKLNAGINGDYLATGSAYQQTLAESSLNIGNRQAVTGFSLVGNKIMLVADGDVAVGTGAQIVANTETTVTGGGTVGSESFSVGGDSSTRESSVTIRADQNADDVAIWDDSVETVAKAGGYTYNKDEKFTYSSKGHTDGVDSNTYLKTAKVYLSNTNKITSQNVGVYWDSDVTSAGISNQGKEGTGTALSSIGLSGTASKTFTQKDYTKYSAEATPLMNHVTTSGNITVNTYTVKDAKNTVEKGTSANSGVETTFATLVNNVYQLQAISQRIDNASADNNSYGNINNGTYALGTTISAAETAEWQGGKGFDPIGNEWDNFFGNFTGNGGSNTYGIYDLNINRPTEYYVGLFSGTSGSNIWSVSIIDSLIKGKGTVGGIAGKAENTWFDNVTMRKRVKDYDGETTKTANTTNVYGAENNVGGIVGAMTNSTIRYGINGGQVENGVDGVGGLAGTAAGMLSGQSYTIGHYSQNKGYYSATEDVDKGYGVVKGATNTTDQSQGGSAGGLVGIAGATDKTTVITGKSYSNGQVSGRSNVGGIVGQTIGAGTTISQVYNTNEASTLTTVITDTDKMGAGSSKYGKVTSNRDIIGCVGGIVGFMNDGTVSESYNAGNISGPSSVGGVVGNMQGGTIVNSYSADNNTVLKTSTDDASYYGFTYGSDKYTYDQDKQCWYKNGDTTIALSTAKVLEDAPESGRLYNNRLAYRDATVTATGENGTAGGVVGNFAGGTLKNTYAAGKVSSTGTNGVKGGIIGRYDTSSSAAKTAENLNFYVTMQNVSGKDVSGLGTGKAVGDGTFAGDGADTLKDVTLWQAQNVSSSTSAGVQGAVSWIDTTKLNTTNQDSTWMVYSNSATPTLKCFMNWININRQYVYDGTVHNLKTTDVSNYYGGAFFTGGKGQNVYTEGVDKLADAANKPSEFKYATNTDGILASATDDTQYSSFYQYENSNMWSPQHGYYTDPTAGLIITPKTVTATLSGSKTYGDVTQGYYYNDGLHNYIYNATDKVWVLDDTTDVSHLYKLTVTGTTTSTDKNVSILEAVDENGNYKSFLTNLDKVTIGSAAADTTQTATAMLGSDTTADQKLNAGAYTKANGKFTVTGDVNYNSASDGSGYDTHNYVVNYDGSLNIGKANLIISATGSREYGDANGTTGYTFTNLAQAADETASKTNDGKLKSWDSMPTLTITTGAAGYTLVATEAAKNGANSTSTTIDKTTWVKGTDFNNPDSYTLGAGSFQHKDAKGNIVNELTSANYNIIYIGNASDAQVAAVTTSSTKAEYLASSEGAAANAYTINPATLEYNIVGGHTYGATSLDGDYTVTAANAAQLKNGEKIADLVAKDQLDALAKGAVEGAGIDTTTHVKRDSDGNVLKVYDQAVDSSSWTSDITLKNGSINYKLSAKNLQYTVNPATITYTIGNASKNYGDTSFTKADDKGFTGFVNGETIDSVYEGTKANVKTVTGYTYTDAAGTDLTAQSAAVKRDASGKVIAYTYDETAEAGGVGSNNDAYLNDYTITYVNGAATINPKSITYTVGNNTKTYGDTTVTTGESLGGSYNTSDLVGSDSVDESKITSTTFTSDGLAKTAGVGDGTFNAAGDYEIKGNSADIQAAFGGNYEVTVVSGALTVTPRIVNYKVADNTKVYGNTTADQAFDLEFINDADFDHSLVDTSKITFTVAANESGIAGLDAKAGVGEYEINATPSSIKAALGKNFTINSASTPWGTLTVTPREVTYTVADNSKTYGDTQAASANDGAFTGLVNGDTADKSKFTQAMYTMGGDVLTATKNAGTYTGVIGFTDADALQAAVGENYTVKVVDGNFVIDQKAVDITIDGNSKTYGATAPDKDFTSTISGLVNGDTVELTQGDYTSAGLTDRANAGTYAITTDTASIITSLGTNYKLGKVTTGTLTVNPKNITYTINNASREFASANPNFSGSFADGAIESWDKVGTVAQDKYATTTNQGSSVLTDAAGNVIAYKGDIGVVSGNATTLASLGIADATTSGNYNVTVVNGDLKITPVDVYYVPDTVSYYRGSAAIDGTYTGRVVKLVKDAAGNILTDANGIPQTVDITEYLQPEHRAALMFRPYDADNTTLITSGNSQRTTYNILGSGVESTASYRIANDATAQWYLTESHRVAGQNYGLEVTGMSPTEQNRYDGAKDSFDPGAANGESTFISMSHGGFIPEEARDQLRLLTIEDSGINVTSAINAIAGVTIAPSSYAANNGGGNTALAESATFAGYRSGSAANGADGTAADTQLASGQGVATTSDDEDELKKQAQG